MGNGRGNKNITIKEYTDVNIIEILSLYNSVGWINYTNNPTMLELAFRNSLKIVSAYCNEKLVGIIRVVGDGLSIVYIQDIVVLPEYQRIGIGKKLLHEIDTLFPHAYQKVLLTDSQPHSVKFYEGCGFSLSDKYKCLALVKITS